MKNPFKTIVIIVSALLPLNASLSSAAATDEPDPAFAFDRSYRCSLLDACKLGTFNNDFQDWQASKGCRLSFCDGKKFDVKTQEGSQSLLVTADDMAANAWKGISKDFAKPLDLSRNALFEFNIFATSDRPGREDYVRLILSDGKQNFEARSEIIPSMWRTVTFDISSCAFLKNVRHIEIALQNNSDKVWNNCSFMIDDVKAGKPLDLFFSIKGSSECFSAENGKVGEGNDAMTFIFRKGKSSIGTAALVGSRNSIYNPPIDTFNTFFIVLANKSAVSRVRLYYSTTTSKGFTESASKTFRIIPNSAMTAYYVNISDTKGCKGYLTGFRLVPLNGNGGQWAIDRVSILREKPIETYAGQIACRADKNFLEIKGTIRPKYLKQFNTLTIYEAPLHASDGPADAAKLDKLTKLYEGLATEQFNITSIPNSRMDGKMSMLSTRMLAVLSNKKSEVMKIAPYFYIENWRDFENNPYAFTLPAKKFNVLDFGAKGNGFTDDTEAINKAISACSEAGGGQVVLPGNALPGTDSVYGRRYVATNIMLKDNVDLHFEKGAIIWQSADRRDYKYNVAYGHNNDIPNIPWTHCLFVNLPLVELKDLSNVKITGEGEILMYNLYTLNPDIFWLHAHCSDEMHLCPLGVHNSKNVELTDFNILLSPNYFTQFCYTSNLFIGNIKMAYPTCTSGDGLGFSNGMNNVKVVRAVYSSNDDGVTITSSYGDPRNTISPWRPVIPGADNSNHNIVISHSYINSDVGGFLGNGGAHAIAFLPWGTTNPNPEHAELDNIHIYDCVLRGPYAVGIWPDNPFDGKPFTNDERNDFAAIKNVSMHNNEYIRNCDFLWVTPTNFTGDTGIHSTGSIVNGDFAQGHCYWSMFGSAGVKEHVGFARDGGRLAEGLYLKKGKFTVSAEVYGEGSLEIMRTSDSAVLSSINFNAGDWQKKSVSADIGEDGDYFVGFSGKNVQVRKCESLQSDIK